MSFGMVCHCICVLLLHSMDLQRLASHWSMQVLALLTTCEEVADLSQAVQTGADAHGGQRDLLKPGRVLFGPEGGVGATGILGLFSDTQGT